MKESPLILGYHEILDPVGFLVVVFAPGATPWPPGLDPKVRIIMFFIIIIKMQLCPMCFFNDHGDNLLEQEAIMVTLVTMMTIEIFSQGRAT